MERKRDQLELFYIAGSAVPEKRERTGKKHRVSKKSREQIRREHERKLAVRRNRERSMFLWRGRIPVLILLASVCGFACMAQVYLRFDITMHMLAITDLEKEISDLRMDNDIEEGHLDSGMSVSDIKARAEELGLTCPSPEQVQYYSVDSSDYMTQYSEVASE